MTNKKLSFYACIPVLGAIGLSLFFVLQQARYLALENESSVSSLLTETSAPSGFSFAESVRNFHFPTDHLAHKDFRSEWWYFTGNLRDKNEREYGFDLTVFRFGLKPEQSADLSPFRSSQIFLAHFAIADVERKQYLSDEKFSRELVGVTGISEEPFKIQIENWSITQIDNQNEHWALVADNRDYSINLNLEAIRPVVLQGEHGLSRKSAKPGNASYYYSIPKLTVEGAIKIGNDDIAVTGSAWFDREWSTSALEVGQVGWDWFGLHIANDMELMFYQIRQANGKPSLESHGVLILDNGAREIKLGHQVKLTPLRYWTSEKTRARYPIKWRLSVAEESLDIIISAKFNAQQWDGTFVYWEGAVTTNGVFRGREINGQGFLEMTGYDVRPKYNRQ